MGTVRHPDAAGASGKPRSVVAAVATGLTLGAVVIVTLLVGEPAFFGLALVAVLIAQAELYAVLKASGQSPVALVGLVSGGVLLVSAWRLGGAGLALGAVAPLPLLMVWAFTVPIARFRSTVVSTYFGIVYGPLLIGFGFLLLRGPDGLVLTATVVGMTAMHDSGGYLVGRKLGRHPMAPRTSPKKSWEGFVAGTVVMVGLSVAVLPFVHPFDVWLALRLALVVSVTAPIGDLAESLIKRDLGVKDMGSLIPGHGGFFDRIDGMMFSVPAAYLVLRILGWAG